jgi:signal transduction histidine kinase
MVRQDPGAVLWAVRCPQVFPCPATPFSPLSLQLPDLLDRTCQHLRVHQDRGFVNWTVERVRPVYEAALAVAHLAWRLAERTRMCDPEYAWVGGLLAPLGWLAVSAVDPSAALACLEDADHARQASAVQKRHWGLDQAALARRLNRRWNLPPWLAALTGFLGLPVDLAQKFGAVDALFTVVQAAVVLVQQRQDTLHLDTPLSPSEAIAALGLSAAALEEMVAEDGRVEIPPDASVSFTAPSTVALLPDLLALAAENRRLAAVCTLRQLETDLDGLHDALRESRLGEAERLRAQKLNALAEFAAGAGHEINNPLAVISGQAQFLLNKLRFPRPRLLGQEEGVGNGVHETPAAAPWPGSDAEVALRKIVEQAQRIHEILREVMLFARPARPHKEPFDLGLLVREVITSLADLARQRQVRLLSAPVEQPLVLTADAAQVRMALTHLLRNAIEAAPVDGWASVRLETSAADRVEVVIEDNGEGPPPLQREHLFDPFYCGRAAGRGRGLGLPTAWRLARQHGGDVRLASLPGSPTRFVLSLARSVAEPPKEGQVLRNGADH